jgi:hypothetical protein
MPPADNELLNRVQALQVLLASQLRYGAKIYYL